MAITINVNGVNSGGGNQNQQPPTNPTPPTPAPQQQPTGGQFTPIPPTNSAGGQNLSQPAPYQRPDFTPYSQSQTQGVNSPLPTSDRLVNDVRAEISRRGIMMVPGTQNFSTMLNTLRQNQHSSLMGQIDNQYALKMSDIDSRKDALMYEVKSKLDSARDSELAANDPAKMAQINRRYDRLLERETSHVDRYFAGQYEAAEKEHATQTAEAEQRLTEALQRLTDELTQGNKDSYLNNLRDKYREQIWRRDNAGTEEEVREASREAAKIQERMQRAMGGGMSPTSRFLGTAGTMITTAINGAVQLDRIGIQQDYVGFDMASSILNGNATAAIRQENALKEQRNTALYTTGGALAGAAAGFAAGSFFPGVGNVVGTLIGLGAGILGGAGGYGLSHIANRSMLIEDERTKVADLWKQEEQRMMGFNDLVMLVRGRFENPDNISSVRNYFANSSGIREWVNPEEESDAVGEALREMLTRYDNIWRQSDDKFDIYDLGYTAPEFAQKIAQRIKQRGYVGKDYDKNALYADALERIFSMNSGALGQLSKYDRFVRGYDKDKNPIKNNANQDFTNLAYTLADLGTTGMEEGAWARSDEFAGYMAQLQGQQRNTFLTVDNVRAARQIATGQKIFGEKFGAEALQGIQQVNNTIQNPKGGFAQTLLYDVVQEFFPDTRGRIDKIEQALYDPAKQNRIQQAYQRRIQSIYGGVDTTAGYLAAQEIWGIQNPNVMMDIVRQLGKDGGLEQQGLNTKHAVESEVGVLNNGYTPEVTQRMNAVADQQMKSLIHYQEIITEVVQNILDKLETSISEKLQEAVDELRD